MKVDPADAHRLLVVKPSSLGDVIHTLPAVAALHRTWPHLEIQWLVNTEWAPLLRENPALSSVIEFPRREFRGWRDLPRAKAWSREHLRPFQPEIAVDFQGLLRSALLARASRAREITGFRQAREGARFFYHQKVDVPDWNSLHAVKRYLRLVEPLGVPFPEKIEFALPQGDPVVHPDIPENFVLLHPFSRGIGKSLSPKETAEICNHLGADVPVVIAGAGFDWPANVPLPPNATDLLNRTSLSQLILLMRRASWILSVDSGPMHLAAAITSNLLSVHTWTDPLMVGPYRPEAWIWRDGFLEQIRDIEPGRFPENRANREKFTQSLLPPGSAQRLAEFVKERISRTET